MSGFDPDNSTHQYLRRTDGKLDRLQVDMDELKTRTATLEVHMRFVNSSIGGINKRVDRLDKRLSHVETRLCLVGGDVAESSETFEGPRI